MLLPLCFLAQQQLTGCGAGCFLCFVCVVGCWLVVAGFASSFRVCYLYWLFVLGVFLAILFLLPVMLCTLPSCLWQREQYLENLPDV
jgi:hypothetical protein